MPRAPRLVLLGALAAAAAACGNASTPPPDIATPLAPAGQRTVILRPAGVSFTAPANWTFLEPDGPLAGGVVSRRATLAVWRYPRTERLPVTRGDLAGVQGGLLAQVRQRDPTFAPAGSRLLRRGGAPAIELTGDGTIAGQRVRVRSAHVYARGAEIVLDAYAPPADFGRLDRAVFVPALRSLELRAAGS